MKLDKILYLLILVLFFQGLRAQPVKHLQLASNYPAAAQFLSGVYNPEGTPLAGKKQINGMVFFWVDKTYFADNANLKPFGSKWKFEVFVPRNAKVMLFRFTSGNELDNNQGKGYISLVYQNNKPVPGAYVSEATIFSGMGAVTGKIDVDADRAIALFEKEFALYPGNDADLKRYYYQLLLETQKPGAREKISAEAARLEKSRLEKDLILATNYLSILGDNKASDSMRKVIVTRFPKGYLARDEMFMSFLVLKDTPQKQKKYNQIQKAFPEKTNPDVRNLYDALRLQLAKAYLEGGDYAGYDKYFALVQNKTGLDESINQAAGTLAISGRDLDRALKLSKQAMAIIQNNINDPFDTKPQALTAQQWQYAENQVLLTYTDTYAYILYRQGKTKLAASYIEPVFAQLKSNNNQAAEHYATIMSADGKIQKAVPVIEGLIKQGKCPGALINLLKTDYIKINGSDNGFNDYLTGLQAVAQVPETNNATQARSLLYQPAPAFELKDTGGNLVNLAALKGKVVLLYFWASTNAMSADAMPGMQSLLDKYQNNGDVKILLIDTWENSADALNAVEKYLSDNRFTFSTLVDEKDDNGRQARVASLYHIEGLPAKILIDKAGNVKFVHFGFVGKPEDQVTELSGMIDAGLRAALK